MTEYTIDELMICRMAKELKGEMVVGWATYVSALAAMLAKKTHAPDIAIMGSTSLFDTEVRPSIMLDFHAHRFPGMKGGDFADFWDIILGGNFAIWVSPAQIDQYGNSNISCIGSWEKPSVPLIGPRGVPDDTVNVDAMFYYLTRQSKRNMVEKVDFICGVGYGKEREEGIVRYGAPKMLVTNLAVFDFDPGEKRMRIASLHPGVKKEEVLDNLSFSPIIPAKIPETSPPTSEEIRIIRKELDPLGVRKLEFLGGKESQDLFGEILRKEKSFYK